MNVKQIVSMWLGVSIILFTAFAVLSESYNSNPFGQSSPDYPLFLFCTFLILLVTAALIITFRTYISDQNRSRQMNLRKGFRRLAFILSLIPVLIGITMLIGGVANDDEDLLFGGILTALIGNVSIWVIYGAVLYIANGFYAHYCGNCEKEISRLEEKYKFNGHIVCSVCNNKLNSKKEGTS